MSTNAVAELIVAAPLTAAFAEFIDFSHWDLWMPVGFRPISGPARALREADRFKVALGPRGLLTTPLTVIRLRPNKEICWRGGLAGVLTGEHSFFFSEASAEQTRIRSEEPLSGLLTHGLIGRRMELDATQIATAVLSGFAEHLAKQRRAG